MKTKLLLTWVMVLVFTTEHQSFAEDAPVKKINQLVQAIITKKSWPPDNSIEYEVLFKSTEFVRLTRLCEENWKSVAENLESVASSDAGKSLLIMTLSEGLEADSYMVMLEQLAEKFQKKQVSEVVMKTVLHPVGRMQAFLVDNYKHPRIQAFLNGLKSSFAKDASTQTSISRILSGEEKESFDNFRQAHEGMSEGNIPKIILPPATLSPSK